MRWSLAAALLVLLAACSGGGGASPSDSRDSWSNEPGGDLLWSVPRLRAVLDSGREVVVVDCRQQQSDFDGGHIPGAIWINWKDLSTGNHETLPATGYVESYLGEQRGIVRTDTIVLYGAGTPDDEYRNPFRLFWMLEYYGCRDVHVLDGGIRQWVRKGHSLDLTPWNEIEIQPAEFLAEIDVRKLAEIDEIRWAVENSAAAALIDVRTPAEYSGEAAAPMADRAGRIPRAANIYWYDCIDPLTGLIHKPSAAKSIFRQAGVAPGDYVYTYANSGVRSTVLYFLSRLLGYPAAVYLAGYQEWSDVDSGSRLFVERSGPFLHKSADDAGESPRFAGASAALGGRIFVFGGLRYNTTYGTLSISVDARLFDPGADPRHAGSDLDCWRVLSLPQDLYRWGHCAAADPLLHAVYIFGGIDEHWQPVDSIVRCDVDPATFEITSMTELDVSLPAPVYGGSAVYDTKSGRFFIFGGANEYGGAPAGSVYAFTPESAGLPNVAKVASLPSPRMWCGAAAAGGKIYCAGGEGDRGRLLANALAYDPAFDTWSPLGSLRDARLGAQCAIAGARMYVCGGFIKDAEQGYMATGAVESCDFSAAAPEWRCEEPMATARYWHSAESVGGKIYLIGGYKGQRYELQNTIQHCTAVEYSPGQEMSKSALPDAPQYGGGTAVIDGRIYIFGGNTGSAYSDRVMQYDPAADVWSAMDLLPHGPVMGACAVSVGESALVMGGLGAGGASREVWKFNPAGPPGGQWTRGTDMPEERYGASAVAFDDGLLNVFSGADVVLIIGGRDSAHAGWHGVTVYDVAGDSWLPTNILPLPQARCWAVAACSGTRIYSIGGIADSGTVLDECLCLDLERPDLAWAPEGAMPTARFGHACAAVDGALYIMGGLAQSGGEDVSVGAVEVLDCGLGTWTQLPDLTRPLAFSFAAPSPAAAASAAVLMIGGYTLDPQSVPRRVASRDVIEYSH